MTDQLTLNQMKALAVQLSETIPAYADNSSSKAWTRAVYDTLSKVRFDKGWEMWPKNGPYAGEYLCDFMLIEAGYGCRIACESQWEHRYGDHQDALDWAFDKLRGVKGDLKLFIFEGTEQQWLTVQDRYLKGFAQLSTTETYVALRWEQEQCTRYIWSPTVDGLQCDPPTFEVF